jgi:hypothetical protein
MRILFLSIIAVLVTSCSTSVRYRSPEVSGFAVDAHTDKPIAGLTVSVSWKAIRRSDNPHNPDMLDIHSATAVTDTNGAFVIPAWGPVSFPSGWRYFSSDPVVSFSKLGQNLGYWDNQANGGSFDEIYALPLQTVDFGKPSWDAQKLKLPQWKLEKPLW